MRGCSRGPDNLARERQPVLARRRGDAIEQGDLAICGDDDD
jgi:hypothetical protein